MRKPAHGRALGKRIVEIRQEYAPPEPAREGSWSVVAIVLDDGSELRPIVEERDVEHTVRLVRVPASRARS
jgi:hypothetical protein